MLCWEEDVGVKVRMGLTHLAGLYMIFDLFMYCHVLSQVV